jgi:salicylate hydroxylase
LRHIVSGEKPVLVVGAGLCGLTTALALIKLGVSVRVAEQAPALHEVGAGLTLSRGTMRCLEWLGLATGVMACSEASVALPFLHYKSGKVLRAAKAFALPTGPGSTQTARQLHRADLHALLVEALRATGNDVLLERKLIGITSDEQRVNAQFTAGTSVDAALLVGCDGVRSAVRELQFPERGNAEFSGQVAFRCLVPGAIAQPFMSAGRGAVYVGPGHTINRYSLRGGAIVNCVGLARASDWRQEGWSARATNGEFLEQFSDWHSDVVGLIGAAPANGIIKWAIFEHQPMAGWSHDRVTLAGDAAHPMLPFLGLGAAMAIEDGVTLAQAIASHDSPAAALVAYETARLPRTRQIFELSQRQGELLQSVDPDSYATAKAPAHDPALFDFDPERALT